MWCWCLGFQSGADCFGVFGLKSGDFNFFFWQPWQKKANWPKMQAWAKNKPDIPGGKDPGTQVDLTHHARHATSTRSQGRPVRIRQNYPLTWKVNIVATSNKLSSETFQRYFTRKSIDWPITLQTFGAELLRSLVRIESKIQGTNCVITNDVKVKLFLFFYLILLLFIGPR